MNAEALASPSAVRAMVWCEPQATSVTLVLRRLVETRAGVRPWLVVPLPSWL